MHSYGSPGRVLSRSAGMAVFLAVVLALVACANVPSALENAPEVSPLPSEVAEQPARWQGERVRWGGRILAVENDPDATWVAVLYQPLQGSGRPDASAEGAGRFMARFDGFRDPLVYEPGKSLTVVGTVDGTHEAAVGDYPYSYPVVQVDGDTLWAKETPHRRPPPYYDRCWDPFWDPYWYPRYRYPPYCW